MTDETVVHSEVERLKSLAESWEAHCRFLEARLDVAFDALLWIGDAPDREDLDERGLALAVRARGAVAPHWRDVVPAPVSGRGTS